GLLFETWSEECCVFVAKFGPNSHMILSVGAYNGLARGCMRIFPRCGSAVSLPICIAHLRQSRPEVMSSLGDFTSRADPDFGARPC
ncbi:MAG: hypothetical protein QNL92_13620, partial [Octadecabacter sp.]